MTSQGTTEAEAGGTAPAVGPLDVSRSAVSQRLTAIERKLVCERARDADVA